MKGTLGLILVIAVSAECFLYGQDQTPPPVPSQEEPEVLNQGPIHEGFAQPLELVPQAGIIAPKQPPADVAENPSAERPSGSEYVWIPGYWAWDTERNDYVWVSGCWRVGPTGMSWIPGYWKQIPQGWQWVAGFWTSNAQADRIQYLPQPPEIADTEPPGGWGNADQVWVPPCYYWVDNAYTLRPGYWLTPPGNWVWVPSHYAWTPYGYVFVAGYWDYPFAERGVLYAPLYFPPRFYRPPGYRFSLGIVVNTGNLEFSLFSYPRYCHYYFGDYYSDFYAGIGIYPWFDFEVHRSWYDPIYEYDRYHYRRSIPHWDRHIRHEYEVRRTDAALRPPRTYRQLESHISQMPRNERDSVRLVEPIRTYAQSRNTPMKFSRMSDRELRNVENHTRQVDTFRQQRRDLESRPLTAAAAAPSRESERIQPRTGTEQRPAERAPAPTVEQPRTRTEQRTAERAPATTVEQPRARTEERPAERAPAPTVEQPRARTEERPTERAPAAAVERPSERAPAASRRSSEQMNFPKSPVSGKRSRGFFQEKPPSRPQTEERVERRGAAESRGSERGRSETRRR